MGWATSCYKKIETPIRAKTRIRRPYTMNLSVVFNPSGFSTSRKYLYISDIMSPSMKSRGAIIGKIIGKKSKAISRMAIGAGGLGFAVIISPPIYF
mgnify:CR=1 FL=1